MTRRWLVSLLVALLWGSARAQTTEILFAPDYVAGDGSSSGGTPTALYVRFSGGSPNTPYYIKSYITKSSSGARTWNPTTQSWVSSGSSYSQQRQIQTDASGQWQGWIHSYYYESTQGSGRTLKVRVTTADGSTTYDATKENMTVLDMSSSGNGCWVYATASSSTQGQTVAAYDAAGTILGSWVIEDNQIDEGYPSNPGYFKMAVPANTTITKLETRDANNGVADEQSGNWTSGGPGSDTDLDEQEDVSLPVSLMYFRALEVTDQYVLLEWRTASETEAVGFTVWRGRSQSEAERISPIIPAKGRDSQGALYRWQDADPVCGDHVRYWLQLQEMDGTLEWLASLSVALGEDPSLSVAPSTFSLGTPFPNPFGPATGHRAVQLRWSIAPGSGQSPLVELAIFDVLGRTVRRVRSDQQRHYLWDGTDARGEPVRSGTYIVRLKAGGREYVRRVIYLR